ncbi:MAG TPA: hypothetical protein VEV20_07715 [Burkholderiales bacterium]|nr:hypothetical protein [Burkholderiales bacterium]
MTAAVLETNASVFPAQAAGRTATALRSLMQIWEQESLSDDEESESELMVMLSGMVGSHATTLDAE